MTTILVDKKAKILAADNQVTYGNGVRGKITKIWAKDGIGICVAGSLEFGILLKEYFFRLLDGEDVSPPDSNDEDCSALGLIMDFNYKKPKAYFLSNNCVMHEIEEPFYATGSGGQFALGAIAAGADPIKAIKIAHKFDPGTGSGVLYFDGEKVRKA